MDPREYAAALDDVEARLDRVRGLYEQWFQGFERVEPRVQRRDLERHLYALRKQRAPSTALRFRFNNLWQRFVTMQSYWGRVARQIEEGTYRRDLLKLRRKRLRRREAASRARREREAEQQSVQLDVALDDLDAEIDAALAAVKAWDEPPPKRDTDPAPPPVPPPAAAVKTFGPPRAGGEAGRKRPPPPPAAAVKTFGPPRAGGEVGRKRPPPPSAVQRHGGGSFDEQRLREVHRRLVETRRRHGLGEVSYEKFSRSVQRMLPELQRRARGRSIDFDVVVRNGKVGLKPKIE